MKKLIKWLMAVSLLATVILTYKILSIALADSVDYTRNDWLSFKLLASNEVINAPMLSSGAIIHYRTADGSAPQIEEIEYSGSVNKNILINYLRSSGYSEIADPVFGSRWALSGSNKSAYIATEGRVLKLTFIEKR